MAEHKDSSNERLKQSFSRMKARNKANLEVYRWCEDRHICPSRFFFPVTSLLVGALSSDHSVEDKAGKEEPLKMLKQFFLVKLLILLCRKKKSQFMSMEKGSFLTQLPKKLQC